MTLSALSLGEQFVYEFDFGDSWTHLCTVGPARIDPESELGITTPVPERPFPRYPPPITPIQDTTRQPHQSRRRPRGGTSHPRAPIGEGHPQPPKFFWG
jgi:hypothetical protein